MPLCYLPSVFQEYQKISGRDIEDSIKREMSGCLEDVFLAIGMSVLWHVPPKCNSKMEGILYSAVFAAGLLSGGTVQCRKNIAVTAWYQRYRQKKLTEWRPIWLLKLKHNRDSCSVSVIYCSMLVINPEAEFDLRSVFKGRNNNCTFIAGKSC